MSDPVCQICHKPIPAPKRGFRVSRKVHPICWYEKKRRQQRLADKGRGSHVAKRKQDANDYGPTWHADALACRKRDGYKCVRCGRPSTKNHGHPVDHIIPLRLVKEMWGESGFNDEANLWSLCGSCHGRKGIADTLAKNANTLAWVRRMLAFCGSAETKELAAAMLNRFKGAMDVFGLKEFVDNLAGER